jgi:tRNA pseudouridine55 synthase
MTKKIANFMDLEKEYIGIIKIGATTKTFDTESEEENHKDTEHITDEEIQKLKELFTGEIEQIPPMHSAIKFQGKPIYKLARKGKSIELKPRKITIKSFDISKIKIDEILFKVLCSKGTYIRSLANDFGAKLGVGGYLKSLRRTRIGDFTTENLDDEIREIKFRVLQNINI